ncbi:MAG: trigger factor [Dysgonamonadaceae bacterium]|jgi:trigger factor|nr:trigger factor [Dysgonamonadaceae bacterium]
MEITLKNIDAVNAIIKIKIVKEDYAANVENALKKLRQKADFQGFRKGMVPMGMIKKVYGTTTLAEEINKLVSDNLTAYIKENNLTVLGEPLPNETQNQEVDFDTQEDFEFDFDIALAPEVQIEFTKKDRLSYYIVKIDDEMLNKQIESFRTNYGSFEQVDEFAEKDMLKGTLTEWENNAPKTNGLVLEDSVMMPAYIKDKDELAKFDKVKKGDTIVFNPVKAYENNETEIASFLKIDKKNIENYTGDFRYEIKEITRYRDAEINEEFFKRVFPSDEINSEEDFREKLRASMAAQYLVESDYKFLVDFRQFVVNKKAKDLQFPDAILKRWLLVSDKKHTEESVEQEYPKIIEEIKYHLVREQLIKAHNLTIEEEEIIEYSRRLAKTQFIQYGLLSPADDIVESYADNLLKRKDTVKSIIKYIMDDKLIQCIQELIKVTEKEVSLEEFQKLFN